jgi:hypothetical protein
VAAPCGEDTGASLTDRDNVFEKSMSSGYAFLRMLLLTR